MAKYPYIRLYINGKRIDEHRYIMEQHIGRKLKRNEYVHHKNGNKRDNDIDNLEIVTPQKHNFHHKQVYPITKLCVVCGTEFTPFKTKRKRNKVCSNDCALVLIKESAEKRKRPINQYTKEGMFIKCWDSGRSIQNELGYYESNINKCCNNKIQSCHGYVWKYADEDKKLTKDGASNVIPQ